METAKEIIHDSLPIKCLEAVIVALYLTVPLTNVQRFTLGFKSKCGDLYYRYTAWLGNNTTTLLFYFCHHYFRSVGLSQTAVSLLLPCTQNTLLYLLRHVVLGVHHGGSYGALGLSRRKDLMYKPLVHKVRVARAVYSLMPIFFWLVLLLCLQCFPKGG